MDLVHCIQGNFLVLSLSSPGASTSAKTPGNLAAKIGTICRKFVMYLCRNDRFLAIYVNICCHKCTANDRRWQWSYQVGVCFRKNTCDNPLWKGTEVRPFDFVMWIAPTDKVMYWRSQLLYICRKWSRIMTSANLIWSFLIVDMKFYGGDKGL